MTILEVKDLHKTFGASSHILRGVSFKVEQGEFVELARAYADRIVALKDRNIFFEGGVKDLTNAVVEQMF